MTWRIPSTWTPERDAIATRMWLAGDSATIIGMALNVSRNAVIGRIHRMGIQREFPSPLRFVAYQRATTIKRTGARKSTKAKPMKAKVIEIVPTVATKAKPFLDLKPSECRYGLNDPGPGLMDRMLCCAAPTALGEPWCAKHRAICWVLPDKRAHRRKAA